MGNQPKQFRYELGKSKYRNKQNETANLEIEPYSKINYVVKTKSRTYDVSRQ